MVNVFITGGAGFLGRALIQNISYYHPEAGITVYSRDEAKQAAIRRDYPACRFVLGDVRDRDRLELAMTGHKVVIHAAAMKYVPEGEINVSEAVAVNIDGSRNVAQAAIRCGVERVIGISTDKACQPVSVYGMTKSVMERLFQEADAMSETIFNLVRYGNVMGSTGSVIPFFQKLARDNKPITLTNPEMTRFWISKNQAVELVLEALQETEGGTILIPRAWASTMTDLAEAVALMEERDPKNITIIGHRFGEKVHEDLLAPMESMAAVYVNGKEFHATMRLFPLIQGEREGHIFGGYSSKLPDRSPGSDSKAILTEMIEEAGVKAHVLQ